MPNRTPFPASSSPHEGREGQDPGNPLFLFHSANRLFALQKNQEAIPLYQEALRLKPDFFEAHYNLANLYLMNQQIVLAIAHFKKALDLNPNSPEALLNLGLALSKKGAMEEARECYDRVLKNDPLHPVAHNNLGNLLKSQGRLEGSIRCYRRAIQSQKDYAEAHYNLGNALMEQGKGLEAEKCYRRALEYKPNDVKALNNLANVLKDQGQIQEAISSYKRILKDEPNHFEACNGLGGAFQAQGRLDEAIRCFRRALAINPDFSIAFNNLLMTLNYHPGYSPETIFSEHQAFSKHYEDPLVTTQRKSTNKFLRSDRRLKIGYVSPDFRRHSVGYFIESVLAHHDHLRFEITCYSDVLAPDTLTQRLQGLTDHWRPIVNLPDNLVAEKVRQDDIDLLIDLCGHTGFNRLLLFARKPAPVQLTWIGYPNTTGLSAMDYRIVDSYTDPLGLTDSFNSEKLVRLPETFICYTPDQNSPPVGPLPARKNGFITFGSFNNIVKITEKMITLWSSILSEVPGARLLLKARALFDPETRKRLTRLFQKNGIPENRLILLSRTTSVQSHLETYNQVDISLDSFPYHGTTTTCEALWMGVPVITLEGNTHVSRVGVSLLNNVGLPELIAKTGDEYRKIALRLANDQDLLKDLRAGLRPKMSPSPLTNTQRFTRYLEECYQTMWKENLH